MVDISPQGQFLMALNNAFQAARSNAPQGNLGAGIPGVAGGSEDGPGSPGGGAPAGVSIGGGVPGTALTGTGVANALIGGAPAASAEFQQVLNSAQGFQAGDRDRPGGADVTGGSGKMLAAILSGNPILIAAALAGGISGQQDIITGGQGQNFGLDGGSDTLSGTTLSGSPFDPSGGSFSQLPNGGRLEGFSGNNALNAPAPPSLPIQRNPPIPPRDPRDRPETQSGSGASPNRGTGLSNAGR